MHGARSFVKVVVDAAGTVEIAAITQPKRNLTSAEEAVQLSLDSELKVTRQINALMDLAIQEKDHPSGTILQWFVVSVLEEGSSMETLLRMIQRAGENRLLFVESYLALNPQGASG